ncbi:hypothetical protein [Streptomyces sp. NPDC046197]|uniref:hypothetical protein n=1 Tax=Streptomyces sp. NPDC046197 TaxID=3154337 RepID=UPI00340A2442
MTQSGQGEEPSARPAHEGIVLPSDGGEPLLPGMTGEAGGPPPAQPAPASAPAGGQAWGQPWGPGPQQAPPAPQDQGWQAPPAQPWASEGYQQPQQAAWGTQGAGASEPPHQAGAGPLPPEGAAPASGHGRQGAAPAPSHGPQGAAAAPSYGRQGAAPAPSHGRQGAAASAHGEQGAAPAPFHGRQGPAAQQPYSATGQAAAPLPPAGADLGTGPYGSAAGQPAPYAAAGPGAPGALPPAEEGATQYLPPAGAAPGNEGATQYLPPVAAAASADEGATQYIPPVTAGAPPHEAPGDQSTRFLGRVPHGGPGPLPPAGGHPDAEATQYIAPVDAQSAGAPPHGAGPGGAGVRQTPAEFDNLFRGGPGGGVPGGSTQQLPRVEPSHSAQPSFLPPRAGSYDGPDDDGGRGKRSRLPVIAAVGVGLVVLGVGAGALLSGGNGSGGGSGDKNQNVAASSAAPDGSSSAAADPARQQAVALDKLLADSGSSRASVIKAVADVKGCDNPDKAASDLRDAAKQRNDLVTSLGQLSVDKLPGHAELTAALNGAWKASASADDHYAAWADQTGGKRGCKKGHARVTGEAQAGNRASGVASAQKAKAAQLWNAIAQTYGLTQRQPTQL